MFKKILEIIREAIRKMVSYKEVTDIVGGYLETISEDMTEAIDIWKNVYKNKAPWINKEEGIYSLNLGVQICTVLRKMILAELSGCVTGADAVVQKETRAAYENEVLQNLIALLPDNLEKGLAMGGFVIKPYVSSEKIYFDICLQGEFYPIAFDNDNNMVDVAFIESFVKGGYKYTRIERHTQTLSGTCIENKAFKAQYRKNEEQQELGIEVPLTDIERWKDIEPNVLLPNADKPLYGYYRVPVPNNIDLKSPLGVSVYHNALGVIERADQQYSRLDWEYEGGQMAVDVDEQAIKEETNLEQGYFNNQISKKSGVARLKERLYRKLDMNQDDSYHAFAPALRDESYIRGLNKYLQMIENIVGLARGTLSEVSETDKTATEIKSSKQKSFDTVQANQNSLEKALYEAMYAVDELIDYYELCDKGETTITFTWGDSILVDTDTELEQKILLENRNILSKAEVRAWYTGEDEELAEKKIERITKQSEQRMLNDIFSTQQEETLE